ncbi:MAG: hypothetical protein J6J79_00765 [Lachnospiraceae bacterium]|nr:hypothetical protein [Lachnospiraceae bacterium]
MFGYVIINKGDMKFKEFDVYQSYYCGLCRALKERHGVFGQMSLTYDMTFLVMLLSSLYEPETKMGMTKCIAHPFEKHQTRRNDYSDYGADMNVLFAYYKCLDDWNDDKKVTKLAYSKLMKGAYLRIGSAYAQKVKKIDNLMREFSRKEKAGTEDIDQLAGLFGEVMGEIFAVREDEWAENLRMLGRYLGKYIYLLDAYEDVEEDIKKNRFNPFIKRYENPDFDEEVGTILTMMMAGCSQEFEKLPIIENIEILRNILYSGVWYRYDVVRKKREVKGQETKNA